MIDTNFDDLVQQLAARRDQLQAELDAAMDAHGVICRAHDLLAGTATIVTAKVAEAHPAAMRMLCGAMHTFADGRTYVCNLDANHANGHHHSYGHDDGDRTWPA